MSVGIRIEQQKALAELAEIVDAIGGHAASFDPDSPLGEHWVLIETVYKLWQCLEENRYILKWEGYDPPVFAQDLHRIRSSCSMCFRVVGILVDPPGEDWLRLQINDLARQRRIKRELRQAGYKVTLEGRPFSEAFCKSIPHLAERLRSWASGRSPGPRLTVNLTTNVLTLDGTGYPVHEDMAKFFHAMQQAGSKRVSINSFNDNARRLYKKLPDELKSVVDKVNSKGCILKL